MVRWFAIILVPLSTLGRKSGSAFRYLAVLGAFFYLPVRRTLLPPYRGFSSIGKTTVMQIYFTGVQALPLFVFLSLVMGLSFSLVLSTTVGIKALVCNLALKGVAPILVALIILGRSGTAVTVELGNMTVLGEIRLLRRMGIDPFRHIIFPRLVGVTFATFSLVLFFSFSIAVVTAFFSSEPFYVFIKEILKSWTVVDAVVLAEKGLLFGLIISLVSCYQGLSLEAATTEVPKATIRTVIHCIVLCVIVDFLLKIVGM